MVAPLVCDKKARSSSVGFCHVAFECWADERPEQKRFSAVGTVADDWTVNIAATNVLQLCQVCFSHRGVDPSVVELRDITETTIVHIGGRILDEPTVSRHFQLHFCITSVQLSLSHIVPHLSHQFLPQHACLLSFFFGPISTDTPEFL